MYRKEINQTAEKIKVFFISDSPKECSNLSKSFKKIWELYVEKCFHFCIFPFSIWNNSVFYPLFMSEFFMSIILILFYDFSNASQQNNSHYVLIALKCLSICEMWTSKISLIKFNLLFSINDSIKVEVFTCMPKSATVIRHTCHISFCIIRSTFRTGGAALCY